MKIWRWFFPGFLTEQQCSKIELSRLSFSSAIGVAKKPKHKQVKIKTVAATKLPRSKLQFLLGTRPLETFVTAASLLQPSRKFFLLLDQKNIRRIQRPMT